MKSVNQKPETELNTKSPSTPASSKKPQPGNREAGGGKGISSRSAKQGEKKTTGG